jgi:hypothetical protein
MAELGSTGSDNDNEIEDDDDLSNASDSDNINGKMNDKQKGSIHIDDVDDDELERLARINAKFNTKNLDDNSLKPKGANFFIRKKKRRSILKKKKE